MRNINSWRLLIVRKNNLKVIIAFIVAAFIFLLISCASFPCKELPIVDKLPDKSKFENKPSIYLDIIYYDQFRAKENRSRSSACLR